MIAQKVEDMLGKALASFLLLLLGDGAIEATSPEGDKVRQVYQPALPRTDGLSPHIIPKASMFHSRTLLSSSTLLRQDAFSSRKAQESLRRAGVRCGSCNQVSSCRRGEVHQRRCVLWELGGLALCRALKMSHKRDCGFFFRPPLLPFSTGRSYPALSSLSSPSPRRGDLLRHGPGPRRCQQRGGLFRPPPAQAPH